MNSLLFQYAIILCTYYTHRRLEVELLPLDTKIEKTSRNLKKVRIVEEEIMSDHREGNQNIPVVATYRHQQKAKKHEGFLETNNQRIVFSSKTPTH